MMLLEWAITALVVALLATVVLALISLRRIPLDARPKTPVRDRYGRLIGSIENPDYHVQPGESPVDLPEPHLD